MFNYDDYCLDGEVWKDIPSYEGIYQASSMGRIRTVDGKTTHTVRHGVRYWKGRIVKNKTKTPCKGGYKVTLWKDNKPIDWLVARLVCATFYGIPDEFISKNAKQRMTVNHKDGDRFNNSIENLEWMTIKENVNHAFDNGLIKTSKKITLTTHDNIEHEFRSLSKASEFLGMNSGYISNKLLKKCKVYDKSGNEVLSIKGVAVYYERR